MSAKPSLLAELQRRHVYKVGAMYGVGGWLLVQIATQVFPFFDVSNAAVRWVVIGVVAGFAPALVLAWLFDLTPQGIVRTADAPAVGEASTAVVQRRGAERKLNVLLGGLLVLAVAYVVLDHSVLRRLGTSATAEQSIAVLPLANTGGDPANEYFSDGLTEEMIAILARIPNLKLIGRNSSFHFKNSVEDSKSIGEQLGVSSLLEGSVRRQGDHVRIVAELVNAADGRELWTDSYDRDLKDVFAVQTEIATAVAEQLKLKLMGAPTQAAAAAAPDPAAHNALLQGDFLFQKLSEDGVRRSIDAYQEAVRLDPRYALAYARLAIAQRQLAATWLSGDDAARSNAASRQAAQTALTLDPELPRAHEGMGWELLTGEFDMPGAEAEFRRGAALAPGDAALTQALSYLLAVRGNLVEAEAMARKSLAADPLSLIAYLHLSRILLAGGRYDEAARYLDQANELQPQASRVHVYLTTIDILRGDAKAALQHAQQEPAGFWHDYAVALAQQAQGDAAAAEAALRQFIDQQGANGPFQVAALYGLRKEPDRMFEWLDRAYALRDPGLTQLLVTPMLLTYRGDPRFAALCAKLKITAPGNA